MKIAYLHGLESSIDKKDPKIIYMNETFDEVYAPSINYRDPATFNKLLSEIKRFQPDLIVGSSMGGYVSYLIGAKLSIPALLFNPAMVGRSFDPMVDNSGLSGTYNTVYFGKNDKVINSKDVRNYFDTEGVGNFTYKTYNGEHRVPSDVFINAIKNVLHIREIYKNTKINQNMKHVKLFEQFLNEEAKPAILVKLFKELAKAKNVEKIVWGYDGMEEFPHIVHFASGLESEAPRHEGELEEFSFYLNDDGETILGIYDLSGNDQELETVKDAVNWCRANEKQPK
jgi:hypothetical protein